MKGILFVAILCVSSSYKNNYEQEIGIDGGVPDTVQWWIGDGGVWRIRTFGIDHDIHVYQVEGGTEGMLEYARESTEKHFGDIVCDLHEWSFKDATDSSETGKAIVASGLEPRLDFEPGRFLFWKPDNAGYRSQTRPE